MSIRLIKSSFYNEQETKLKLCEWIMKAEQFSIGKYCSEFEQKFADWQGRKYCVFMNSGSSANLALIQSLLNLGRLKKGDRIGFSSLTWATNAMPLIELGLTPVPIDIEIDTLNVSSRTLQESHEDKNLQGFMITNLLGFCDDIDSIELYCQKHGILFLEDNCESMGTVYKGKKLGNYSFASTFSTYVGHHMSTVEGGMVCTDDEELYAMLIMVRAHGWDRNLPASLQKNMREKYGVDQSFYAKYTFYTLGYNLRPNEINGFIGCEQVQYLDEIVDIRARNFVRFQNEVNKNSDFYSLKTEHLDLCSNFAVPIICKSKEILDKYILRFTSQDIEIRPIVGGDMTQQIFWKNIYGENTIDTNAKLAHTQGFYFGNSPEYTEDEMQILLSLIGG